MNVGTVNSIWSLGLRETKPGVWRVDRITPVQIPGGGLNAPGGTGTRGRGRASLAPVESGPADGRGFGPHRA